MQIVDASEIAMHVRSLFEQHQKPYLLFHNFKHTSQVVNRVTEIGRHYSLDDSSRFILVAAAWFHDIGHLFGEITHHEEIGAELMKIYLEKKNVPESITKVIAQCIMATKLQHKPATLLEKILCDADNYFMGMPEFELLHNLYRREAELRLNKRIPDRVEHGLQFLYSHVFYTSYCKYFLSKGKKNNIELLQEKRNFQSI